LAGIRYFVQGSDLIDIAAPADASEADIRLWLLGTVVAALLHQRGYLPIHANVVARRSCAAAFAGESGAGKSTLAAWMDARGHEVLADDLCAVRLEANGVPLVFEGIPRMKLWAEALNAFGRTAQGLERVASGLDKYHVAMGRAARTGSLSPVRLERVYVLDRAAPREPFHIERLSGAVAAQAVLGNAFRWGLGQLIQREERTQFDQCMDVARHTAVFRVRRTWDMERLDEEAKAIERHLMTPLEELRASPGAP
jgi:hypothetical protein